MGLLSGSDFEKKWHCPPSLVLVSYYQRQLSIQQASQITSHLGTCDFCAAELQLLSKVPSATEFCDSPQMPEHLRALAVALLTKDYPGSKGLMLDNHMRERPI